MFSLPSVIQVSFEDQILKLAKIGTPPELPILTATWVIFGVPVIFSPRFCQGRLPRGPLMA